MCMTFAHVAILLPFIQRVEEYLVILKVFDYSYSLGYKEPITSKTSRTDIGLKLVSAHYVRH